MAKYEKVYSELLVFQTTPSFPFSLVEVKPPPRLRVAHVPERVRETIIRLRSRGDTAFGTGVKEWGGHGCPQTRTGGRSGPGPARRRCRPGPTRGVRREETRVDGRAGRRQAVVRASQRRGTVTETVVAEAGVVGDVRPDQESGMTRGVPFSGPTTPSRSPVSSRTHHHRDTSRRRAGTLVRRWTGCHLAPDPVESRSDCRTPSSRAEEPLR